ncbi:helix-turn-helix domain-containing protein [Nonomuraea sp. NPDC050536]|uniref:helix-turn-helix domain-containing protein n=1 Tax=Nonomuraea sp. NPDC050536 TaxID=3364366 RepID=UPI0037C74995
MANLGERLHNAVQERGISYRQLAADLTDAGGLDVTSQYLTMLKRDPTANPTLKVLRALADYLGKSVGWLIGEDPGPLSEIAVAAAGLSEESQAVVMRVIELARRADALGTFISEPDSPAWVRQAALLGLERQAEVVSMYGGHVLPAPLQTDDYARAIAERMLRPSQAPLTPDEVVGVTAMRREGVLGSGRQLWVLVDESVLRRMVGGPRVHLAQLDRLIEQAKDPAGVTVQILPLAEPAAVVDVTAFSILRFTEPHRSDVLVTDGDTVVTDLPTVEGWRQMFAMLSHAAMQPDSSIELLNRVRHEYATHLD